MRNGQSGSALVIKDVNAPMPLIHSPAEDTDGKSSTNSLAEQVPFADTESVFSWGELEGPTNTAMLGRDADSIATTLGSWIGVCGLSRGACRIGRSGTVSAEIDICGLAERLLELGERGLRPAQYDLGSAGQTKKGVPKDEP
jgi:hypothetical protein